MLDRFAAHDFNLEDVAGCLSALVREDKSATETGYETVEEFIQTEDGEAPTSLEDVVTVSLHIGGELVEKTEGYTAGEVLAALENPSTEYYSLWLRLANGFHLGGK